MKENRPEMYEFRKKLYEREIPVKFTRGTVLLIDTTFFIVVLLLNLKIFELLIIWFIEDPMQNGLTLGTKGLLVVCMVGEEMGKHL